MFGPSVHTPSEFPEEPHCHGRLRNAANEVVDDSAERAPLGPGSGTSAGSRGGSPCLWERTEIHVSTSSPAEAEFHGYSPHKVLLRI